MLRALRRAWNNYLASVPKSEQIDSIPPSQWDAPENLPGVSKAKRKAFLDLLETVHSHLSPEDCRTLVDAGAKHLTHGYDIDTALHEAIVGDDEDSDDRCRPRVFIACDWKGTEEVQWQADALCRAHGLSDSWTAPSRDLDGVLDDLGMWLRARKLDLFSFSSGDNVVAFAVQEANSPSVRKNLNKLRIRFSVAGEA